MQAPPPTEYGYSPPKKPSYAWLWIVLGVLVSFGCGGFMVLAAVLFPVFSQARVAAIRTECLSNVKQLATASLMYSTDYDDRLPMAANWGDGVGPYVTNPRAFDCPAVRRSSSGARRYGYAVNADTAAKLLRKISDPVGTTWIYETGDLRANASGKPAAESPVDRHGKGRNESYLDGHAKWVR